MLNISIIYHVKVLILCGHDSGNGGLATTNAVKGNRLSDIVATPQVRKRSVSCDELPINWGRGTNVLRNSIDLCDGISFSPLADIPQTFISRHGEAN